MKNIKIITFITFITFIFMLPAIASAATLSLSPSTGTFNRGCTFSLAVNLNTQNAQTDGTDAIIIFDPTRVTGTNITPGTIYPDYPGTNIDSTGKITISGLSSVSQPFSGTGTLATIDFSVPVTAPVGATAVTFDFNPADPTKTTDSNVVERNTVRDVLSSVTNGSYTIGSGSCTSQTQTTSGTGVTTGGGGTTTVVTGGGGTTTTTTGGTTTTQPKTLPPAGSETLTFTIAIVGATLTILGIIGLAIL